MSNDTFSTGFHTRAMQSLLTKTWTISSGATPLHLIGAIEPSSSLPPAVCLPLNLILLLTTMIIGRKVYRILFAPLDLHRDLGSVGYVHHDPSVTKQQSVKQSQRRKKVGDTPPVFPNGWFRLMDSGSLREGQVRSVYAFGEQLAVFRNKRGKVRVLDAYCPHLGANMAAGGKVVGSDCLECPFHGWKFSGEDGKLVDIPYAQKVPNFVSVKTWPCAEVNDVIYVWHHCDNSEPEWRMPAAEGMRKLKYAGKTEHIINSHIQDIPENAADIAHLDHLHKPVIGSDVEQTNDSLINNLIKHGIKASWQASTNQLEKHSSSMTIQDDIHLQLFGRKLHIIQLNFSISQIGPGAVHIHVTTPFFRGLMVQNITPVEALEQKLAHSFYISPWVPTFIAKAFYLLETTQIERDILMWNNKTYLRKPVLVKEESTLAKHRRWYQQFYSENSPRFDGEGRLVYPGRCDASDW